MHSEELPRLRPGPAASRLCRWLAVLFPFSIVGSVLGQSVITPPPGFQGQGAVPTMGNISGTATPPPGVPAGQTTVPNGQQAVAPTTGEANAPANGQTGETPETAKASVAAPAESLMAWSSTHVHLRGNYVFLYDTGVHTSPGQITGTYSQTIGADLTVTAGPHVTLEYSPSYRVFSATELHNTLDQYLNLLAAARLGNWTFGTTHTLAISDEPQLETASQTSETAYTAAASASYQAGNKFAFVTSGNAGFNWANTSNNNISRTNSSGPPVLNSTNLPPLNNSVNYSASESIIYNFDDSFSLGATFTAGYTEQSQGFKADNQAYTGLLDWNPDPKVKVLVSGGLQDEHFLNGNSGDLLTPVYDAAVAYQMFEHTTLNLSGGRNVSPSLFQNDVTVNTQLGIGIEQRVLGFMDLSFGFGYHASVFKSTLNNLSTSRSDSGTSYSAALQFPFLERGMFGLFFQYIRNSSSLDAFSGSGTEVGASLSWGY